MTINLYLGKETGEKLLKKNISDPIYKKSAVIIFEIG
ncbi:hypothetical protein SRABI134_04465 [Peribacillus sp. Bi134]|nr:hypothetical protein SRABI134_04465 [Peribacillus sp. Bi134]